MQRKGLSRGVSRVEHLLLTARSTKQRMDARTEQGDQRNPQ